MQGASLILTSYQDSLQTAMNIIANNVANINTTGFKREEVAFDSYLMQPTPKDRFQFSLDRGSYRDSAQGPTVLTGNPLDVAIQGQGYLPIQTEAGVRYTRAGAFQLNSEGDLVTAAGDRVLGDGDQTLTFPTDARDIAISSDGTISAQSGAGGVVTQIGRLRVLVFEDERALKPEGKGLYSAAQTPLPSEDARLVQGAIEQSNVQSISEMTHMIEVSRVYQQVVRLLELEGQRQTTAIQRLGRASA